MNKKIIKGFMVFKRIYLRLFLFMVTCAFFQCTAFFNTHYNGKSTFNEASKAHSKLLRNYPDSIIVSPTPEIAKKYDRSIEKANKVVEVYKKAPRWQDDALLLMGKSYYFKRENLRSLRILNQLLQEHPKSALIPEAYFYIGKCNIDLGEFDKAEQALGIILEKYPGFSKIDQVSFLLVHIAIQRGGRAQAISLLEKTRKSVHTREIRTKTLLMIIELYIDLKQYDKALVLLNTAPRRGLAIQEFFRLDKARFTCLSESGKDEKALALVGTMLRDQRYEEFRPKLLLMKASILKRLGRIDEAVAVYMKIVEGVDSTKIGSDTSSVVGKAYYELALIYQKSKDDYKNASRFSKLASMTRDSTIQTQAKRLSSAFEKLEKLRNEKDSTDIQKRRRLFRIGELFRFELSESDSAFYQFLQIASMDTNELVPVSLCAAAFVARDDMKDTLRGDSLFNVLLRKYPSTEYAQLSQRELKIALTVKTRRDSAYEAFREAEMVLYGNKHDTKEAINQFYNVYRNFPDIDIAPKSLFVAAWLVDDQLQKNKTAKELYEKLCEKYPDSYYCRSEAKPRLEEVTKAMKEQKTGQAVTSVEAAPFRSDVVLDTIKTPSVENSFTPVEKVDSLEQPVQNEE